ncbi:MAG: hypothetical protein HY367_03260 [Candidatus Aenigmarchaeota archaeon]|nr:hypothetical protein [Candidatus Aenigmarchaeota archaeon]
MSKGLGVVGIIVLIIGLIMAALYPQYLIGGVVLVIIGVIIAAVGMKGKGSSPSAKPAAMPAKT